LPLSIAHKLSIAQDAQNTPPTKASDKSLQQGDALALVEVALFIQYQPIHWNRRAFVNDALRQNIEIPFAQFPVRSIQRQIARLLIKIAATDDNGISGRPDFQTTCRDL